MDAPVRRPDFGEILESALLLPPREQERLCLVLQRVHGAAPGPGALAPLETTPAAGAEPVATRLGCEEWLETIQHESGWNQLQLIDAALADPEAGEEDVRALELARERLLQAQPALAIRHAVVDLATTHPIGVLLGCGGLVLAMFGLGRLVLATLF